ncbi:hypothetical protein DYB32_004951 [Aphanomyces invadans]|uniref:CSC1/OSCA1-like 7TM region domain-containing protein n=1 Tax=Aphanomyces invadans TaxID=157072 RepID=A0A418AVZ7_9STRA|nr:hypothetical protein DYB32_004951 [Aphanomyces invadans]
MTTLNGTANGTTVETIQAGNVTVKFVVDSNPDQAVMDSIMIYYTFFAFAFVLFEVVQRRFQSHFACRAVHADTSCPTAAQSYGVFGWIPSVWQVSDDEIIQHCGLDALCFLRLLRLGRNIAAASMAISCILIPVYATALKPPTGETAHDWITRMAMANMNVAMDPHRLWASAVAGVVITFWTMFLLLREWKVYVVRRHAFLSQKTLQQHTVVMNDLPLHLCTRDSLETYLEALFPGQVQSVHVALECKDLEAKITKRLDTLNLLERALVVDSKCRENPYHRRNKVKTATGNVVDAIPHFTADLARLNYEIRRDIDALHAKEDAPRDSDVDVTAPDDIKHAKVFRPTALVTFRSHQATQCALQMLQTSNPAEFSIIPAPHPSDMIWANLGQNLHVRNSKQLVCTLVTVVVIVMWSTLTLTMTSLANVENWRKDWDWINELLSDYPNLVPIFKQLSPLGLVLLSIVAPYVFSFISYFEGHASRSETESAVFTKLLVFQFYQTFVVTLFGASLADSLPEMVEKPVLVVYILSQAVPKQASLYMSYLIIQTGLSLIVKLYRMVAITCGWVYKLCAPKLTPRERRSPWLGLTPSFVAEVCDQSYQLPTFFLGILLVLVFCPITPLLSWFGGVFLVAADIVYRRLFLFVFSPAPFTTGVYWPKMYTFIVRAMYVAQIVLIGMLWLRVKVANDANVPLNPDNIVVPAAVQNAYWYAMMPTLVATALPVITWIMDVHIQALYPRGAMFLPLVDCVRLDADGAPALPRRSQESVLTTSTEAKHGRRTLFSDDIAYLQPALLESDPLEPDIDESKVGFIGVGDYVELKDVDA